MRPFILSLVSITLLNFACCQEARQKAEANEPSANSNDATEARIGSKITLELMPTRIMPSEGIDNAGMSMEWEELRLYKPSTVLQGAAVLAQQKALSSRTITTRTLSINCNVGPLTSTLVTFSTIKVDTPTTVATCTRATCRYTATISFTSVFTFQTEERAPTTRSRCQFTLTRTINFTPRFTTTNTLPWGSCIFGCPNAVTVGINKRVYKPIIDAALAQPIIIERKW